MKDKSTINGKMEPTPFPEPQSILSSKDAKSEYLPEFLLSWRDALENLETMALELESDQGEPVALATVKRLLHTVKGDSSVVGIYPISDVFHQAEDDLEMLVSNQQCPTDYLLSLKDWLQEVIIYLSETSHPDKAASSLPKKKSEKKSSSAKEDFPDSINLKNILIAEDDLTTRTMLQAILSQAGYTVVSVADGNEAWALLQSEAAPRLLILDWMMPGMDGLTLCRWLREQKGQLSFYIILLTSKGEKPHIIEGLEAGADDYIAKPYDNSELLARVHAGFRILSLQAELRRKERMQGVLEMAGAVCHELNQPLQIVLGYSELLLSNMEKTDAKYEMISLIQEGIERIGRLTHKIMHISKYRSRPYLCSGNIIDIENASKEDDSAC